MVKLLEEIAGAEGYYLTKSAKAIQIKPLEIKYEKYYMPNQNTLEHPEWEDIAARLVEAAKYCKENGSLSEYQWVGVAYKTLAQQYVNEIDELKAQKEKGFKLQIKGVSKDQPDSVLAHILYFKGDEAKHRLHMELNNMVQKGYLDMVREDGEVAIFPTSALIQTIFKKQNPIIK